MTINSPTASMPSPNVSEVKCRPYDESDVVYQVLNGGKGVSVKVREVEAYGVTLPKFDFTHPRTEAKDTKKT